MTENIHEVFNRPGVRAARLSIAAANAIPLIRYKPPVKLCVASRNLPVIYGPANPPTPPTICSTATAPAAAVPVIIPVVKVQNGPIMLHNPTAASVIAHNATTSE